MYFSFFPSFLVLSYAFELMLLSVVCFTYFTVFNLIWFVLISHLRADNSLLLVIVFIGLLSPLMSWDGGNGYKAYIFEESTRRCAIDRKGRGCKEVIYLRVADVSCTQGICESTGLFYGGPCGRVL